MLNGKVRDVPLKKIMKSMDFLVALRYFASIPVMKERKINTKEKNYNCNIETNYYEFTKYGFCIL